MTDFLIWAVSAVGGYLLGSVPFGLVLSYAAGYGDIRTIGSGNIGATNVLRTGNKWLAFATLVLDAGKGAAAVFIAHTLAGETAAIIAGVAALAGHLFPVWLSFKGGKGVATTLGTALALSLPVGGLACAAWLAVAIIFRISSLSSLSAMIVMAVSSYFIAHTVGVMLAFTVIAAVVVYKHRENIQRLARGEEPRIGQK